MSFINISLMISPRMICFFFQMFEVDAYLPHHSVVSLDNITIIVPNTDRVLISNFTYHFKQVCGKCILHYIRKRTAITRISINYKLLYDKVPPRSQTPNTEPQPQRGNRNGDECLYVKPQDFPHFTTTV